jgi:adenine-specific DNA-methyltransferase
VESGEIPTLGQEVGVPTLILGENQTAGSAIPSIWTEKTHRTSVGNEHLKAVLGDKRFPYPKPVPLISDVIRGFTPTGGRPIVVDFFAGSGTTIEAVMDANAIDGGLRQAIVVTNNEVSVEDSSRLRSAGMRKGDAEWESCGVFERVAFPRIRTIATGIRSDGTLFSDGFEENVEFFTLTYEAPLRVASNREFRKVAPLLWMRAGAWGRRVDEISRGWDVAEAYGVLSDLDKTEDFLKAIAAAGDDLTVAFIVTDEDRLFESVVRELPEQVEPVRLYEAYLRNFEIESGRGAL